MSLDKNTASRTWTFPTWLGGRKRTPIIRQSEKAECGLACIAMILGHHGHHVSMFDLRSRTGISSRGAALSDLMRVAETHGLFCRPLRLELNEIEALQTPCILHWRMDHFVVLVEMSKNRATIHDPASGRRTILLTALSRSFTGIALEFTPVDAFVRTANNKGTSTSSLVQTFRSYVPSLWSILGFSLALEFLALLMPQLVQVVVDQVLTNGDHDLLTLIGIGFVLLTFVQSSVSACRSWSVSWMTVHGSMRWTGTIFHRLLRLQQRYFERRHVGDVVSRIEAVRAIQQTLTSQFFGATMDGLVGVATLILLAVYSPALTFIVILGTLVYSVMRLSAYGRLREVRINQVESEASQRTDLVESIRGIQTIRLNNKTAIRSALHANITATVLTNQLRNNKLTIAFEAIGSTFIGLQRVAVLWVGASLVMRGQMSAGMLMAVSAYADQFSIRSRTLIDYFLELRLLRIQFERVADITQSPEEPNIEGLYQGPEHEPSITFDNISYRHSMGEPWILRNASLTVRPGESIAIVGPSGAGKSTTLSLLLGLVEPCAGIIRLGSVDLASLGKSALRERTGAVLQDDHLFSGTIAENICFFDPVANIEDIYLAARLADIHDEICAMLMGYRTMVGDMGSGLSGGQRQRIILARAIYRKPSILVLDEATSHLDVDAEKRIAARFKSMKMTRITVAHRPETIQSADRVVALVDEKFVEVRSTPVERLAT